MAFKIGISGYPNCKVSKFGSIIATSKNKKTRAQKRPKISTQQKIRFRIKLRPLKTMNALSNFPSSLVSPSIPKRAPHSKLKILSVYKTKPATLTTSSSSSKPIKSLSCKLLPLLQYGAFFAAVEVPAALAVTGENNSEEDLVTNLIYGAIIAFGYFFVAPPIIMNWMRLRWYKRKFFEMYLQFMFTFIFFPGLMLWAPFINFRKFPRDETMEYPWSTPKDDPNIPLYKER